MTTESHPKRSHGAHAEGGGSHAGGVGSHGVGHIVSEKILIANAAALLVLTFITVAVAKISFEEIEMHELTIIVALGIAMIKAALVCLFFMHLRWDRSFNSFVLVGSLGLVALFIVFSLADTSENMPEVNAFIKAQPGGETLEIKTKLDALPPPLPLEVLEQHAPQEANSGH